MAEPTMYERAMEVIAAGEKACPQPWKAGTGARAVEYGSFGDGIVMDRGCTDANRHFIALARNHAPAIAAELLRVSAENERLRAALDSLTAAAVGLSRGDDWNGGAHAKKHGYRKALLDAIPPALAALAAEGAKP